MIAQMIAAFLGVVGFAIYLEVPKKYLLYAGIAGTVGWTAYLLCQQAIPAGGFFVSSFCIALMSQIFARKLRCPVTVFLIPAIFPSVPGAGIYRTVYYLMMGDRALAGKNFLDTLTTAGMLALGIYIVDIFWKLQKAN